MPMHLQKDLEGLKNKVLSLSLLVEESVERAVKSVHTRDGELAKQIIDVDDLIDVKEVEIEEECLKILALYQPVAIDLRYVIAILKINNDLERVGDLSVNIAERALYLSEQQPLAFPFDFQGMEKKTRRLLKRALDSLILMDVQKARKVCDDDEEIDQINREMYDLVTAEILKKPEYTHIYLHYLSISRHLERIGDYATNIAEDVIYMVQGDIVRHHPEDFVKLEESSQD